MEQKNEVKTLKIEYKCPKCETGYLIYEGTLGIMNVHLCDSKECEHREQFKDKKYPYIEYERLTPMEQLRKIF